MELGGGPLGGNIIFQSYPVDLLKVPNSYTFKYLNYERC